MSGTYAPPAGSPSYGGKPSPAVLDYAYSFADEINANEPTDSLTGATITIDPEDGSLGASQIDASGVEVTFWLQAGIPGACYRLLVVATTSGGRTLVSEPNPVLVVT